MGNAKILDIGNVKVASELADLHGSFLENRKWGCRARRKTMISGFYNGVTHGSVADYIASYTKSDPAS